MAVHNHAAPILTPITYYGMINALCVTPYFEPQIDILLEPINEKVITAL